MEIVLDDPVQARLLGFEHVKERLKKELTYTDERVLFELSKTTKSLARFLRGSVKESLLSSWGSEKYEAVIAELEAKKIQLTSEKKKCLLFEDDKGLWTYSGLAASLAKRYGAHVSRKYFIPAPTNLPYANLPRFKDRYYQTEAQQLLLAHDGNGPVGIELPTGAGKSTVIRNLLKELALPALIMAPSTSIAGQLYDDLVYHFGKRYVGMVGDGKKEYTKTFIVAIDDSLAKIEPGTEAWANLSCKRVFIADESHLCPASTLQKVCFGLARGAQYRYFVSATQMRNDGLDLVLEAITGPIIYRKTLRELVDDGFLAKPVFKMVKVKSYSNVRSPDANRMTREHLYYNPVVNKVAASLADQFVEKMKRPVVILVEELEQFRELLRYLKQPAKFAHGPLTAATRKLVPCVKAKPCTKVDEETGEGENYTCEYHGAKPKDLVAAFNRGEIPILVGTSCIATGTDIQVAEAGIYLMGGKSEIKLKQGVGRETRGGFNGTVKNPWTGAQKVDCVHVDFQVVDDNPEDFVVAKHAEVRRKIYKSVYDAPKDINYTHVMA